MAKIDDDFLLVSIGELREAERNTHNAISALHAMKRNHRRVCDYGVIMTLALVLSLLAHVWRSF